MEKKINIQDDDGHWYYIPEKDVELFQEYEEISTICWEYGAKPTKKQYTRCKKLTNYFTPMMTGNGPI